MVNMAAACLREEVVAGSDLLDGAMIFGAGFAPFRGGPVRYAQCRRIGDVSTALSQMADRHGERFRPDPGLDRLSSV